MEGLQDEQGSLALSLANSPTAKALLNEIQSNQEVQDASGDEEYNYKARKPYTITKQRERWSEEEHNKFIEALKLHGRAWRRIEEHIGTKTAVQIRSHAQKFFCKVVRDSRNSNPGSIVQIEIPPPRPKRKPTHPYPRKVGTMRKRGMDMKSKENSCSPSSGSDQENGSPTSVLSATRSSFSDFPLSSTSQMSSVGPSLLSVLGNEKINEEQSRRIGDCTMLSLGHMAMVQPKIGHSENSPVAASRATFKLFGRAVAVTDPQNTSLSATESVTCYDSHSCPDPDLKHAYDGNLQQSMPPNFNSISLGNDISAFYGGGHAGNTINSSMHKKDNINYIVEKINTASIGLNFATRSDNMDTYGSRSAHWCLMSTKNSSFNNWNADQSPHETPAKGFVPYKKRESDREPCNSKSDSLEDKRIRLCL